MQTIFKVVALKKLIARNYPNECITIPTHSGVQKYKKKKFLNINKKRGKIPMKKNTFLKKKDNSIKLSYFEKFGNAFTNNPFVN